MGESVGVIAAQSIGEPGTQLQCELSTLVELRVDEQSRTLGMHASAEFFVSNLKEVRDRDNSLIVLGRRGEAVIVDQHGREKGDVLCL